jgi:capsular polysaccharide biosynthesis protein
MATLIESDPAEEFSRLITYVPFRSDIYFEKDPSWGIYDRDGQIIRAAAHYRGPNNHIVGQSSSSCVSTSNLEVIDEPLMYCGPFMLHYGHFLTTTLPRFWQASLHPRRRLRLLCHAHQPPSKWFECPFVAHTLGAIGIGPADFVWLDRPAVIRKLWIPRPAMREQHFVHRAFESLAVAIGRIHGVHCEPQSNRTIYLSKTRLRSGITRFEHEEKLEQHLAARGFEIVHPEELPFPDQLRLLAGAHTITGTLGSGFHTSVFLDRPSRIVALAPRDVLNSNYVLIDILKENKSLYLSPSVPASAASNEGGFQTVWRIADISAVAEEFADRVHNRRYV